MSEEIIPPFVEVKKVKSLSYEAKLKALEDIKEKLKSGSLPISGIKAEMKRAEQFYMECREELKELETVLIKMELNSNN